jgi:very-short-patch-repair endonuclease
MRKEGDNRGPDAWIARLASNQHGVLSTAQIASAGLSHAGVTRRVRAGRLHRIHRGVYAVGHWRLSDEGRWMAAVLACGEGAVLSHLSAAELWGIRRRTRRLSGSGVAGTVHVTAPGTAGRRKRNGVILHRSSTLTASDCTRRDGIPVTRPTRTLSDLRPLLSPAQFNSAVREAEFLSLPIRDWLDRGKGPRGDPFDTDRTRTELERRMLALCRRHRLPRPEVNVKLDRFEVDFLWRDQRLVVEVDGWGSHRTRTAFEEDRARDARLEVLGYRVVRFTWRQLTAEAAAVAQTIRALLRARSADQAA